MAERKISMKTFTATFWRSHPLHSDGGWKKTEEFTAETIEGAEEMAKSWALEMSGRYGRGSLTFLEIHG